MPNYDVIYKKILSNIEIDYAGYQEKKDLHHPRFFLHAIGQAYKDRVLNEVLFLQYINQYLRTMQDYNLNFQMKTIDGYRPGTIGFRARRYGESLYVSDVYEENRLNIGDEIVTINGKTPKYHRDHIVHNIFGSEIPENENFTGLLKMASVMEVKHVDGTIQKMKIGRYDVNRQPVNNVLFTDGTPVIRIDHFDESIDVLCNEIGDSKSLIVDLRHSDGGSLDAVYELLSYIMDRDTPVSELMKNEGYYTNYTEINCEYKRVELENIRKTVTEEEKQIIDEMLAELQANSGKGLIYEEDEAIHSNAILAHKGNVEKVVILCDCYTSDEAELLIRLAMKYPNVVTVGRETSGKYNYMNEVSVVFDSTFVFQYPMSKRKEVEETHIVRGIIPDINVPFTPEECHTDCMQQKAIEVIK